MIEHEPNVLYAVTSILAKYIIGYHMKNKINTNWGKKIRLDKHN